MDVISVLSNTPVSYYLMGRQIGGSQRGEGPSLEEAMRGFQEWLEERNQNSTQPEQTTAEDESIDLESGDVVYLRQPEDVPEPSQEDLPE